MTNPSFVRLILFSLSICIGSTTHVHHSTISQVVKDNLSPLIIVYQNGTIMKSNRIPQNPVPPQPNPDPVTRVISKDVVLDPAINLTARMYLPSFIRLKLPILVYFHGGGFCIGTAFDERYHAYLNKVVSQARVVAISINYRLFPEFALPTAYNDAWFTLRWVARGSSDPWLAFHGDLTRLFLGGDSAGANIVHNLAMRATAKEPLPCGVHIHGAFLGIPYFLGSGRVPLEPDYFPATPNYRVWRYVCPREVCPNGVDESFINPLGPGAPTLARIASDRVMVYTAEMDDLRGRGMWYVEGIRRSGWRGELLWFEANRVGHGFHIVDLQSPQSAAMIYRLAKFLQS